MTTGSLIQFLNATQEKGFLSPDLNKRIQGLLDYSNKSSGKLFLSMVSISALLFIAAGMFTLLEIFWTDIPKHVRGVLSLLPAMGGAWLFYKKVIQEKTSASWNEAVSLFLMLMIGASMALFADTYQMEQDVDRFITVWLCLTLPIFYISKSTGLAILYLALSCNFILPHVSFTFIIPSGYDLNEKYYLFWCFFIAYLPFLFMRLMAGKSKQGLRTIYLGWVTAIAFIAALPLAVQAGYLWWALGTILGFYLIGKKFYAQNLSVLGRPFQTIALFFLFVNLLNFSDDFLNENLFRLDQLKNATSWTAEQTTFYMLGVLFVLSLTTTGFVQLKKNKSLNRVFLFTPVLFVLLYGIYCLDEFAGVDIQWLGYLVLNLFTVTFGIHAIIQGHKSGNVLYMIYGLLLVTFLLWMRFADTDIWPWLKAIFFIGAGGIYLIMHYIAADEYELD